MFAAAVGLDALLGPREAGGHAGVAAGHEPLLAVDRILHGAPWLTAPGRLVERDEIERTAAGREQIGQACLVAGLLRRRHGLIHRQRHLLEMWLENLLPRELRPAAPADGARHMQAVGVGGLRQFEVVPDVRGGLAAVVVVEILPDQLVGVLIWVPGELEIEPGEQIGPRAATELWIDRIDAAVAHEPQVFRHIEDRRPLRPVGIPVPDGNPIRGDLRPVPDRLGVVAVGGARGDRPDLVAGGILAPGARHDIDPEVFVRHERRRRVERLEVGERDHPGFGVGLLDDLHRLVEGQD